MAATEQHFRIKVQLTPSVFEPEITGEPQEEQYLTVDTGSGPNYDSWNDQLSFHWKNRDTGDWLDASGTPQGTVPFGTTAVLSAAVYQPIEVTALVAKALATGNNRGLHLVASSGGVECAGRLSTHPPTLQVVTDQGSFDCACQSSAYYMPQSATSYPQASTDRFNIATSRRALLRFDLAAVAGMVQSATLQIYISTRTGSSVVLQLFEPDLPEFMVGCGTQQPQVGLAALVGEASLASHPDVYMAGDFAGTTFDYPNGLASSPKLFPRINIPDNQPGQAEVIPDVDAPGTYCWRGAFVPVYTGTDPKRGAFSGTKRLMSPVLSDPAFPVDMSTYVDEAYYRMYVMLEDDFDSDEDGNKMGITWDLRLGVWNPASGGYWQNLSGNGGNPGRGVKAYDPDFVYGGSSLGPRYLYYGNMQRMEGGRVPTGGDGVVYGKLRPWQGYNYNLNQFDAAGNIVAYYPGIIPYNNIVKSVFARNRWYCVEQHIKMNSIDLSSPDALGNGIANPDGLLETWVNGILIDRRNDYRWRRHPEMGVAQVNANWYMGGQADMTRTMHFRMNHLVLAKSYIGPRVRP